MKKMKTDSTVVIISMYFVAEYVQGICIRLLDTK